MLIFLLFVINYILIGIFFYLTFNKIYFWTVKTLKRYGSNCEEYFQYEVPRERYIYITDKKPLVFKKSHIIERAILWPLFLGYFILDIIIWFFGYYWLAFIGKIKSFLNNKIPDSKVDQLNEFISKKDNI